MVLNCLAIHTLQHAACRAGQAGGEGRGESGSLLSGPSTPTLPDRHVRMHGV